MRPKYTKDALATLEVDHFYSGPGFLLFGSSRPLPETDLKENKLLPTADEKPHSLGTRRESRKTEWPPFPTILCQGAPSFRYSFSQKRGIP